MKNLFKSLIVGTGLCLFAAPASATNFTYEVSSLLPPAGPDVAIGGTAGDASLSVAYDTLSEVISLQATFFENSAGSIANFFFFTITDGAVPDTGISGNETTIFVDLINEVITGYEYTEINGAVDPTIAAASGDLVFNSDGLNSDALLGASVSPDAGSLTVTLSLASSLLPGVSFGEEIGVWFQYFGIGGEQVAYDESGRLITLAPDIGSEGGYSFIDVAGETTTPGETEVPEPGSLALLLIGLSGFLVLRKRA